MPTDQTSKTLPAEQNSGRYEWTGNGPQIDEIALSDGSKVFNVVIQGETIFCRDQKAAIQLIADLNAAAGRAI